MTDFNERREGLSDRRNEWLEEQLCAAMAKAMRQVILDPEVIAAVGEIAGAMLQESAKRRAGGLVLGAVKAFFSRWIVIAILLLLLGQIVGLPKALQVVAPAISKGNP